MRRPTTAKRPYSVRPSLLRYPNRRLGGRSCRYSIHKHVDQRARESVTARREGCTAPLARPTKKQTHQKNLAAISCDSEMGLMQLMVTLTHHDRMPEMLAAVRRGPFAEPTAFERVEYLFSRVKKGQTIPRTDKYGLEHCLSYQRRVHAIKVNFLRRQHASPLGIG